MASTVAGDGTSIIYVEETVSRKAVILTKTVAEMENAVPVRSDAQSIVIR